MKPLLFLSILFGFLGCSAISSKNILAENGYAEIEVDEGGTVIGNVKYLGELATPGLNLYRDWKLSDTSPIPSEKLIFSKINNGLKNAVVSIKDITRGKKRVVPTIRPIIDQQNNIFIPHVTAILVGTTIDILNGDKELHTIHTRTIKNQPFNLGTTYRQRIAKTFEYPEIIKLTCDIHKKSYAWIVVLDNPYFDITDRNGYFEICDIPPGTYKFQVWHEELGNLEKEVTVHPKEITSIELVYSQD
jgi:plastocyanin